MGGDWKASSFALEGEALEMCLPFSGVNEKLLSLALQVGLQIMPSIRVHGNGCSG